MAAASTCAPATRTAFCVWSANLVAEGGVEVEAVGPADSDLQAVYRYLMTDEGEPS